jgi:hypothetical protein
MPSKEAKMLEDFIRQSALWQDIVLPLRSQRQVASWLKRGREGAPPHSIKVRNLISVADLFGLEVMVETGTFKGQMIDAGLDRFRRIYSIEIYKPLADRARKRFAKKPHITIINDDSTKALPALIASINEPVLFWLDGHLSGGGTSQGDEEFPALKEIKLILERKEKYADAIIVDDVRYMDGVNGRPQLESFVSTIRQGFGIEPRIADDALFVLPA